MQEIATVPQVLAILCPFRQDWHAQRCRAAFWQWDTPACCCQMEIRQDVRLGSSI